MKFVQASLHIIRKKSWKHRKALLHFDRTIKEIELAYLHTDHTYDTMIFPIHEIKMYRIREYFEYKDTQSILKKHILFTA